MNVYKLRPGISPVKVINKLQFEQDTMKSSPWYQSHKDDVSLYAVCPACNNPIQIIALYKRNENSPQPYGKHIPKSINGLAKYNHGAYLTCPYANPGMSLKKDNLRSDGDSLSLEILSFLKQQFDRVIYILQRETGIIFNEKLLKDMLISFLRMHGHQYAGINLCNLPWIFAYMTTAQSLFGKRLQNDCPLMMSLKKRKEIAFSEDNRIQSATNKFFEIQFAFIGHEMKSNGAELHETIDFVVSLNGKAVHTSKLIITPMRFHNLVNLPPERARRNPTLLRVAEELIP